MIQEPDRISPRSITVVGIGLVVITLVLCGISWLLVRPSPPERAPAQPNALEHGLIDEASGGADATASGAERLARYRWVDRSAHLVAIPIESAIDAVVADPTLIGGYR